MEQYMEPIFDFVKITPEMAKSYLEQNLHVNRKLRAGVIETMARDMQQGNWRKTHQGIAFDVFGRLVDGQHRLNAIIKADVPVVMMVTRNINPDAFSVIDTGTRRILADNLKALGVPNQTMVAALTVKILAYQRGLTSILDTRNKDGNFASGRYKSASREEQIEFFHENRDMLILCAEFGRNTYAASSSNLITGTNIAFLYWLNNMSPEFAEFIRNVVIGINIKEHTTAYHLRRLLEEMKDGKRVVSSSQMLKAWANAYAKRGVVCKKFFI
jgi:hypothetical protein